MSTRLRARRRPSFRLLRCAFKEWRDYRSYRETISSLRSGASEFSLDRMEGSHMILIEPAGRMLSVPRHRELGRGLLRALIRDAGLTRKEFVKLLR